MFTLMYFAKGSSDLKKSESELKDSTVLPTSFKAYNS